MISENSTEWNIPYEPVESLNEVIIASHLDINKLKIAVPLIKIQKNETIVRENIDLYDGNNFGTWHLDTLTELFRGNKIAPSLEKYPEDYVYFFYNIESNVLTASTAIKPLIDDEFIEIYSTMHRRPDGKSLGFMHDVVWQATALTLGKTPVSQNEFEAVLRRLARSVRTWKTGYSSRNYVAFLENEFQKVQ